MTIGVDKATPDITWADPADISYGTALSSTQLDATSSWTVAGVGGSVAGTFVYTPDAGTVLSGGTGQTLSVTFTPSDAVDYNIAAATATINVDKATPTIAWLNPADITYGTASSTAQLDAIASEPGTLVYNPAPGTVLHAGAGQTLSVTFVPTDSADYADISDSVTIDIAQAGPIITWANPADITYGTALSAAQLDAAAAWTVGGVNGAVAGSFTYIPAAGTVLQPGTGQTLSVSFTPSDTIDYKTAVSHGDGQRRASHALDHLGQPRRHHLWHRALGQPARRDIVVDSGRSEWKCRGNVHVHSGRGHGPHGRYGPDAHGHVHSD